MITVNQDGGVLDKEVRTAKLFRKWSYVDPRFYQYRGAWGESWLGPVTAPWGSSPYMDWYNEQFYIHARARAQ